MRADCGAEIGVTGRIGVGLVQASCRNRGLVAWLKVRSTARDN